MSAPVPAPVLACDMGGTRIKLGIVRGGKTIAHDAIPAHSDKGLAPRLPALADALRSLCDREKITPADCAGIAISFPSLIDVPTGRILAAYGKYEDGPRVDLRAWARQSLNLTLAIENDARMALIGEWQHGAGRGSDNLVMITLGTGIGTAAVIQGNVLRGVHGQAGCLGGHLTVKDENGRPCSCGNVGCGEAEASTAFLARIAAERPDFPTSNLSTEHVLDYAVILRHATAAGGGDACARALLDHSIRVWGATAVNLIHAYDPEIVILGGGIMAAGDVILSRLRDYVSRFAHTPWGKVKLVTSQLGDQAGLIAAEWLLREQLSATTGAGA